MAKDSPITPEDWALQVKMAYHLFGGPNLAVDDEPSFLVQKVTGNTILCGAAREHFSTKMPVWPPNNSPEYDKLSPIDVLYGSYDPVARAIEIYVDRIKQDAHIFGATTDDLTEVVRIHEHVHAISHLGVRANDVAGRLEGIGQASKTDWEPFLGRRTSWFRDFPSEAHELLAQAITYASIKKIGDRCRAQVLLDTFNALEQRQPRHYRLSPGVKDGDQKVDWRCILQAARFEIGEGDVADVLKGGQDRDFSIGKGLEALICAAKE